MLGSKMNTSKEIVFIEIKHFFNCKVVKLLKSYLIDAVYLKNWTVSEDNSIQLKTENVKFFLWILNGAKGVLLSLIWL